MTEIEDLLEQIKAHAKQVRKQKRVESSPETSYKTWQELLDRPYGRTEWTRY